MYESTTVVEKFLPSANQATTTASIAIVATAAAAATPLLLRVIKPLVKQVIKRVQKALGKKERKLSANEIKTNKYRKEKGLPELRFGNKKNMLKDLKKVWFHVITTRENKLYHHYFDCQELMYFLECQ